MKDKTPKISIIIAVYNGAKTLQRCIDSVANQTYSNIELIIIDGGSTDGTVDIIKENDGQIAYWKSERDDGIASAWNKALGIVQGDWFLILGADDYLVDDFVIENFIERLASVDKERHLVLYGTVNRVNEEGVIVEAEDGGEWLRDRFLSRPMYICHQSIFCHKSLIEKIGLFDTSLRTAMDYDFFLRTLKVTEPFFMKKLLVSNFTLGGVSGSVDDILIMHREIMNVKVRNGYKPVQGYYFFALAKVLVKYAIKKTFGSQVTSKVVDAYRILTGREAISKGKVK